MSFVIPIALSPATIKPSELSSLVSPALSQEYTMSLRINPVCAAARSFSRAVGGNRTPALRSAVATARTYYSGHKRPDGSELKNVRKAERLRKLSRFLDHSVYCA